MNEMTDKQMEVILNLVADKFAGCKDMDEVQKAIDEVRNMAKKEKPTDQALGHEREGGLAAALNQMNCNTQQLCIQHKQGQLFRLTFLFFVISTDRAKCSVFFFVRIAAKSSSYEQTLLR